MHLLEQDKLAITKVITLYFMGTHHGDVNQLETAFHPDAHITGFIGNEAHDWTRSDFINRVINATKNMANPEPYDKEILFIDYTANTAIVKARAVVGNLIVIDYVSLLKLNEHWVIRHKNFTTQNKLKAYIKKNFRSPVFK